MISLVLLGASGSIGSQTLDIVGKCQNDFALLGISIGNRTRKISKIVRKFPTIKAICLKQKNKYYETKYPSIKFFYGNKGLLELIDYTDADMVVNALVGFVGLYPSIHTLSKDKKLALANKEALVVGGEIINHILDSGKGKLYPIDSEHSALWKCLKVDDKDVDKLLITASGGAFRNLSRDQLDNVKASDALKHPTWNMGNKITIDCATLVNKSFEIIEAYQLYKYKFEDIEVVLHKESYVHSMVRYKDNSIRAEISKPDMHNPIIFALYEGNYPFKTYVANSYYDFKDCSFKEFDISRYPVVRHAKTVIDKKGTYGAVFNASNEVAVNAFLKDQISFLGIEKIIDTLMDKHVNLLNPDYETLLKVDLMTRKEASEMIATGKY